MALLAGVSVDYYTRLQRGNAGGVCNSVLKALAHGVLPDASVAAFMDFHDGCSKQ